MAFITRDSYRANIHGPVPHDNMRGPELIHGASLSPDTTIPQMEFNTVVDQPTAVMQCTLPSSQPGANGDLNTPEIDLSGNYGGPRFKEFTDQASLSYGVKERQVMNETLTDASQQTDNSIFLPSDNGSFGVISTADINTYFFNEENQLPLFPANFSTDSMYAGLQSQSIDEEGFTDDRDVDISTENFKPNTGVTLKPNTQVFCDADVLASTDEPSAGLDLPTLDSSFGLNVSGDFQQPSISSVTNQQPIPANHQPSQAIQQPKPAYYQPSQAIQQPIPANYQSSQAIQQPTSANYQPSQAIQQPTPANHQPSQAIQQPTSAIYQPSQAIQQPTPANHQPLQAIQQPTPANYQPSQAYVHSLSLPCNGRTFQTATSSTKRPSHLSIGSAAVPHQTLPFVTSINVPPSFASNQLEQSSSTTPYNKLSVSSQGFQNHNYTPIMTIRAPGSVNSAPITVSVHKNNIPATATSSALPCTHNQAKIRNLNTKPLHLSQSRQVVIHKSCADELTADKKPTVMSFKPQLCENVSSAPTIKLKKVTQPLKMERLQQPQEKYIYLEDKAGVRSKLKVIGNTNIDLKNIVKVVLDEPVDQSVAPVVCEPSTSAGVKRSGDALTEPTVVKMRRTDDSSDSDDYDNNFMIDERAGSRSSRPYSRLSRAQQRAIDAEKYRKSVDANNEASRKCRQKKKEKFKTTILECDELGRINKTLAERFEYLTKQKEILLKAIANNSRVNMPIKRE